MGKRSDFARLKGDFYITPREPVCPLIPHLHADGIKSFDEPCAGNGALVNHLMEYDLSLGKASDIEDRGAFDKPFAIDQVDAMTLTKCHADCFITNPPWTRTILHPLIDHLSNIAPTWLLFDADWMHTVQAKTYLKRCVKIVSVGRVKWIAGSKHTGLDNAAWYLFSRWAMGEPRFFSRNWA